MALTLNPGAAGADLATDVIAAEHYQRMKLTASAAGSAQDLSVAEDAVHASGQHGLLAIVVRSDVLASLADADGDNTALQVDANGALYIQQGAPLDCSGATVVVDLGVNNDVTIDGSSVVHLEDVPHVTGDAGLMALVVRQDTLASLASADGDYTALSVDAFGALYIATPLGGRGLDVDVSELLDTMDVTTGWTVLGDDTDNLATTLDHIEGTAALTFDKVDGAGDTVFAGIQKTIAAVDLRHFSSQDLIVAACLIPDVADVVYVFVRLGSDASNFNEWRVDASLIEPNEWASLAFNIGNAKSAGFVGNGWTPSAVTYIAVGGAFGVAGDTLSGIQFDHLVVHSSAHTSSMLSSSVTEGPGSPNVSIKKWGAVNVTNAAVLTDDFASPTAAPVGSFGMVFDGSAWDRARGNSVDGLIVNLGANNDITIDGSAVVRTEDAPHGSGDTGIMALIVRSDVLASLAGADGDYTALQANTIGALYTESIEQISSVFSGGVLEAVDQDSGVLATTGTIIPALAGKRIRVVALSLISTSTTATNVFLSTTADPALYGNTGNRIPLSMNASANTVPGVVLQENRYGHFETTTANQPVTLNMSAAEDVIFSVSWVYVD